MRLPAPGGIPELVLEAPAKQQPGFDCPVRPGGTCVFGRIEQGDLVFKALDPMRGLGNELARTQGSPVWSMSPEGTLILVRSGTGASVIDLRNGTRRDVSGVFSFPAWAAGSDALFAPVGSKILRFELDGKATMLLDRSRNHHLSSVFASPDGRYLAFSQQTFDSNMWLLRNF
jgi:hypothetical protein